VSEDDGDADEDADEDADGREPRCRPSPPE